MAYVKCIGFPALLGRCEYHIKQLLELTLIGTLAGIFGAAKN